MTPYRIETERLVIRCWNPDDAAALKTAVDASLEHLRPWMPWAPDEPEPLDVVIERLREFRGRYDLGQDFILGIFGRESGRVVGGTGLHTRQGEGALEIGYWIAGNAVGRGYATEAAGVLTRVAFEHFGVDRVEIRLDPANARSRRVPEKLGFQHEATLRRRLPTKQGSDLRDAEVWTLFAAELAGSPCTAYDYAAYDAAGRLLYGPPRT